MANIVSSAGILFNGIMQNVGTVGTTLVSSPLLLTFAILPLAFLGVRMFSRLIRAGRG